MRFLNVDLPAVSTQLQECDEVALASTFCMLLQALKLLLQRLTIVRASAGGYGSVWIRVYLCRCQAKQPLLAFPRTPVGHGYAACGLLHHDLLQRWPSSTHVRNRGAKLPAANVFNAQKAQSYGSLAHACHKGF